MECTNEAKPHVLNGGLVSSFTNEANVGLVSSTFTKEWFEESSKAWRENKIFVNGKNTKYRCVYVNPRGRVQCNKPIYYTKYQVCETHYMQALRKDTV